jgi:cytochrome c oxidase accessory protein FixG
VFTDLFAAVARRSEGWRGHTRPAHVAAWRRAATWLAFAGLSLLLGFHLAAYFRPPRELLVDLAHGDLRSSAFAFIAASSFLAWFDFAILRQTFCKYLCPYARFQGVLFDRDTLVVGYDAGRGEPRGKRVTHASPGEALPARGDCVDCHLCVAVCPTGIDIRNGLQLECIACTQCIDACDGVMAHLGRAPNLIGYRSLVSLTGERPAGLLRPRVVIYAGLLALTLVSFGVLLARRLPMDLSVAHNRDALYSRAADGRIGNAFTLHIQNRDAREREFELRVAEPGFELLAGVNPIRIPATGELEARVFVLAPDERVAGTDVPIHFVLERDGDDPASVIRPARFLAPMSAREDRGGDGER